MAGKSLDGLHPTLMRPRVEALLADPEAQAMGVTVVSAFRSNERQAQLFAAAVVKYGSVAKARKWVAPPGKSNHGPRVDGAGTAVDFGIRGVQAVKGQWPTDLVTRFDAIAARHGLRSPMEWEDWHFEPIANWKGATAPTGPKELTLDATDRKYLDTQFAAIHKRVDDVEDVLAGRVPGDKTGKKRSLIGRIGDAVKAPR